MPKVNTETLHYRPATPEDVAGLTDTFVATLRESITKARGEWSEQKERAQFQQQLRLSDTQVVITQNEQVGFYIAWHEKDHLFLHTLCIQPQHQNNGYGRITMDALVALAGTLPIRLLVLKSNPRARRFYERLGYCWVADSEYHNQLEWPNPALNRTRKNSAPVS